MSEMRYLGFKGTILTYAKETTFNQKTETANGFGVASHEDKTASDICPSIEAWRQGTVDTVRMLGEGDQLAVKYMRPLPNPLCIRSDMDSGLPELALSQPKRSPQATYHRNN